MNATSGVLSSAALILLVTSCATARIGPVERPVAGGPYLEDPHARGDARAVAGLREAAGVSLSGEERLALLRAQARTPELEAARAGDITLTTREMKVIGFTLLGVLILVLVF